MYIIYECTITIYDLYRYTMICYVSYGLGWPKPQDLHEPADRHGVIHVLRAVEHLLQLRGVAIRELTIRILQAHADAIVAELFEEDTT